MKTNMSTNIADIADIEAWIITTNQNDVTNGTNVGNNTTDIADLADRVGVLEGPYIKKITLVDNEFVVTSSGVDENGEPTMITDTINPYSSQGEFGIAIGKISEAHQNSIAIGGTSDARARQGIAIGDGARALPPGSGVTYDVTSVVIGHNAISGG